MKLIANEGRHSVILGHLLEVNLSDDDRWGVLVDGQEILTRFRDAYDAWAVGVAESYSRGRVAYSLPVND